MNNQSIRDDRSDKTVCVDFDGVIHWYRKGYQTGEIYDDPKPGSFQALKRLSDAGYRILIHTARRDCRAIEDWMLLHLARLDILLPFEINTEKPAATIYIDDNAFRLRDWEAQRMELESMLKGVDRMPVIASDSILCQLRSHPLTAPWTDEQREGLAEHILNNLATAAMLTGGLVKVSTECQHRHTQDDDRATCFACGEATQKTLDEPTKCWHHNVFEDISSRDGSVICRDCDETVILCRHQYPTLFALTTSVEAAKHTCFHCGAPRSEQPYGACNHRYPEGVSSKLALCLKCGISKPESVHVG